MKYKYWTIIVEDIMVSVYGSRWSTATYVDGRLAVHFEAFMLIVANALFLLLELDEHFFEFSGESWINPLRWRANPLTPYAAIQQTEWLIVVNLPAVIP